MPCGLTDVFRYCAVLYLLCFCLVSQVSQKAACTMHAEGQGIKQAIAAGLALPLLFGAQAANSITSEQVRSLTYEEVKGTGLANRCPELTGSSGELTIDSARKFKIADLCLEPKSFQIEQQVNEKRKGQAGAKGEFLFLSYEFLFSCPLLAVRKGMGGWCHMASKYPRYADVSAHTAPGALCL